VEYRKQAVAWTLPWSEVRSVEGGGNGCTEVGCCRTRWGWGWLPSSLSRSREHLGTPWSLTGQAL